MSPRCFRPRTVDSATRLLRWVLSTHESRVDLLHIHESLRLDKNSSIAGDPGSCTSYPSRREGGGEDKGNVGVEKVTTHRLSMGLTVKRVDVLSFSLSGLECLRGTPHLLCPTHHRMKPASFPSHSSSNSKENSGSRGSPTPP